VSPDAVSFSTSLSGTEIENIHEFSAQKIPTPRVAIRVARGSRRRGACASSATVEITSKPVNDRIPRIIAAQKAEPPPWMWAGLSGANENLWWIPWVIAIVIESATTTVISIRMNVTADRVDISIPR
jgi:hypothetical protein